MDTDARKTPTVEEQLAEVYALVEELHHVESRLRTAVDTTMTLFKGETPHE